MSAWSIFLKTRNAKLKTADEAGQVLIAVVILFTAILTTVIVGLVSPILSQVQMAKNLQQSKQSVFAAESLAEDMVYRFKTGKHVSASESLEVGGAEATASVTTGGGMQTITVNGDYFDLERSITISLSQGSGIAFNYGLQAGNGGVTMQGNATVNGNIYANGSIDASGDSHITGSAFAADSAALAPSIVNEAPMPPEGSITFRNSWSTEDFAQSFQVPDTMPLNKIQFYIKKVGSPPNASVRLVTDNNGSPSTNTISIGGVSLNAGQVTGSYGWIEVVFEENPSLIPGTTYWIVLDSSNDSSSKYFIVGASTGYASGAAKRGRYGGSWSATNLDGYFRIYTGGFTSSIGDSIEIGGDAWASNVQGADIGGFLYCLTGSGNNKSCDMSRGVPPAQPLPFSDANIEEWEEEAAAGGTVEGDYNVAWWQSETLGPKKINGDLSVTGLGAKLYVTGPIWVTGNVRVNWNGKIILPSTSEGRSIMLVADGRFAVTDNGEVESQSNGSYLFLVSTSECPNAPNCGWGGDAPAISISASGGAIAANAQKGTVTLSGNADINAVTANSIEMKGDAEVTYDEGLASPEFVGGPSGGYTISGWGEVE